MYEFESLFGDAAFIINFVISLIFLIVFMRMAWNIKKIRKHLIRTNTDQLLEDADKLEFKGKKEVVRNGNRFLFKDRDFDNPFLPVSYRTQSSGSRSAGTRTIFDLNHQKELSYHHLPELHVHNIQDFPIYWSMENNK